VTQRALKKLPAGRSVACPPSGSSDCQRNSKQLTRSGLNPKTQERFIVEEANTIIAKWGFDAGTVHSQVRLGDHPQTDDIAAIFPIKNDLIRSAGVSTKFLLSRWRSRMSEGLLEESAPVRSGISTIEILQGLHEVIVNSR